MSFSLDIFAITMYAFPAPDDDLWFISRKLVIKDENPPRVAVHSPEYTIP